MYSSVPTSVSIAFSQAPLSSHFIACCNENLSGVNILGIVLILNYLGSFYVLDDLFNFSFSFSAEVFSRWLTFLALPWSTFTSRSISKGLLSTISSVITVQCWDRFLSSIVDACCDLRIYLAVDFLKNRNYFLSEDPCFVVPLLGLLSSRSYVTHVHFRGK